MPNYLSRREVLAGAGFAAGATVLRAASTVINPNESSTVRIGQPAQSEGSPSLGPVKQIDAGILSVGYVEAGPSNGPPVILLHGWPYDIYSFVDVTLILA